MKYEIGEDGILRQVDDGTPAPAPIKPAETTAVRPASIPSPNSTAVSAPSQTTVYAQVHAESSSPVRRRVNYANLMHVASWILIIAGIVGAGILAYLNHRFGVRFEDYLIRLWWTVRSTWNNLDPLYGFSVVFDPDLSFHDIVDILDMLVLGGGWLQLLTTGFGWFIATAAPLFGAIIDSWITLFGLLFCFLF